MNNDIACEHCGEVVASGAEAKAVAVQFPRALASCFALLSGGIGAVPCPRCDKVTATPMQHVVIGRNGVTVLGIHADAPPELAEQLAGQIRTRIQLSALHSATDNKTFRRLILREFAEPVVLAMNQFAISDEPLRWVGEHIELLDHDFFCVLWLMGSGAVQVYTAPLDKAASTVPAFVPSELAPGAARHLVERKHALDRQAESSGRLIAYVLVHLAFEAVRSHKLAPLTDAAKESVPSFILGAEVLAAAAGKIGEFVGAVDKNTPGWITMLYMIEASLALLCRSHGVANPRMAHWTRSYLFYDLSRRADGNGDELLPPLDLLKPSLDAAVFWHSYREFGRTIHAMEDDERRVERFKGLMEAAGHVFPAELLQNTPLQVRVRDDVADDDAVDELRQLIQATLGPELDSVRLTAIIAGTCEVRPHLVRPVVNAVIECAAPPLDTATRLHVMRCAIEHLNLNGRAHDSIHLAEEGLSLMRGEPPDDGTAQAYGHFYNEVGNCLRLVGRLQDAVDLYEQSMDLIGGDLADANHRVGKLNLAIVLRDLHRYAQAQEIFASLRPLVGSAELRGLVTSEAVCLSEMGQRQQALDLLEQHLAHVSGTTAAEHGVIPYCTQLGFLRAQAGRLQEARDIIAWVEEEALRKQYHAAGLVARDVALRLSQAGDSAGPSRELVEQQHGCLREQQGQQLGAIMLAALKTLDAVLSRGGEAARAEALVRHLLDEMEASVSPRAWLLHLMAARHAQMRGDADQAATDIDNALRDFQVGVETAVASGDIHHFTSPESRDVQDLTARALGLSTSDRAADQRRWRNAADVMAAPVLTSRLRHAADLPSALAVPDSEDARLLKVLDGSVAAVLQVATAGDEMVLLRTTRDEHDTLHTTLRPLDLKGEEVARVARVLSFHLMRADPLAADLALETIPGWPTIAARVRAGFSDLDADRPVLVVAGLLQEATITLALAGSRSVSFVPSLAAAIAQHERHPVSGGARPAKVFGFAAWFDRERTDEATALASVPAELERIARKHGLHARNVAGVEATREELLTGLSACDVAWIACHGRLRRGAEAVELTVAAGGRLAPAHLRDASHSLREAHVVKWQDLASLKRAPAVVLSSACDSGLTVTNAAGERLGLERALFPAGTRAFLAPLWPVPTVQIQAVVARVLDAWLEDGQTPLATHLRRVRNHCVSQGVPRLAADALVLFGDVIA